MGNKERKRKHELRIKKMNDVAKNDSNRFEHSCNRIDLKGLQI